MSNNKTFFYKKLIVIYFCGILYKNRDFKEKTKKIQILKKWKCFIKRIFFSTVYVISLAVSSLTHFFVDYRRIAENIRENIVFFSFFPCFGKILYFLLDFCVFLSVSRETYANIKYEVPNPITPNNADKYTVKALSFNTVENTSVHK